MMFYVGQKVVCVIPDNIPIVRSMGKQSPLLQKGDVYEISWVGAFPFLSDNAGDYGVRLVGIDRGPDRNQNPRHPEWDNYPFSATRFRPVVEKKTDISILTALLNPANHKKLVDA